MQIEILSAKDSRPIGKCSVQSRTTVAEVKVQVQRLKKALYPDRQSIRLEARGKTLKDEDTLEALGLRDGGKVYVKDLGPQIGWKTVSNIDFVLFTILGESPSVFFLPVCTYRTCYTTIID